MDENIAEFYRRAVKLMVYFAFGFVEHMYFKEVGITVGYVMMLIFFTYAKGKIIPLSDIWRRVKYTIKSLRR